MMVFAYSYNSWEVPLQYLYVRRLLLSSQVVLSDRQRWWLNCLFVTSHSLSYVSRITNICDTMIPRSSLPRIYSEESCETSLPPPLTDISNILLTFFRSAISQLSAEQFHCYVYVSFPAKPRQKRTIPATAGTWLTLGFLVQSVLWITILNPGERFCVIQFSNFISELFNPTLLSIRELLH